jgi:hypothetical protein
VEEFAASKYDLDLDHSPVQGVRVDARDREGDPWDVKGAMSNRKRGPGRFRLWEDQHRVLEAEGGGYVFVGYQAREGGINVVRSCAVRARSVRVEWGGSGGHRRDSRQAKVLARSVFN